MSGVGVPDRLTRAEILLESMYQFVGLLDAGGSLLEANRSSLEAVGADRGGVIGLPFWETAWWKGLPEAQAQLRSAITRAAAGEFVRCELEHRGGGGTSLLTLDFSLTPFRDEQGRVAYLVAEGRDITDRKQVEREVVRQRDELRREAELRERFMAILGHDLRNPLNVIGATVQALLQREPPGAARDHEELVRIHRCVAQMSHMISDLLDFSRSRAYSRPGSMPLRAARTDLAEVAIRAVAEVKATNPGCAVRLSAEGDCVGEWDPVRLQQVLSNLLGNAMQHGAPDTPILVSVSGGDGAVTLTVHNEGTPIPPDEVPLVFEPFHRAQTTLGAASGLGLGLFIVREIVEAHGGSVDVRSGPDEGTTLVVRLPKAGWRQDKNAGAAL